MNDFYLDFSERSISWEELAEKIDWEVRYKKQLAIEEINLMLALGTGAGLTIVEKNGGDDE